jgi:hypothetical protein
LIVRGPLGALCGYVGLPPGHPMHGKLYGEVARADGASPDVHGGLTYSEPCQGRICHVPAPGEPDDVHWIGFDCGHAGDYSIGIKYGPGAIEQARAMGVPDELVDSIDRSVGNAWLGEHEVYRDIDYVRREVESLAEQMVQR